MNPFDTTSDTGPIADTEQRFRLLVESIPDYAIVMLDPLGYVRTWNAGAERITGYAEDEALGLHLSRFYEEGEREDRHPQRALSLAAEGGRYAGEGWGVRRDGTRFWAGVSITPLRSATDEPAGFAMVACDHTEQQRLEEAGRRDAVRFRAIYEDNPSIYLTTDSAGVILDTNRFGAEYLGFQSGELVGRSVLEVVHADHRPEFLEHLAWCLRRPGEVHRIEFRKLRKDGSVLWVRETARAVHDPDRGLVLLNVCEDVTDRVAAEEESRRILRREREAREQITRVLESITDAFFALDREWRFTYVNRQAERVLRRSREELLGASIWDEFPDAVGSTFYEMYHRAAAGRETVEFEEYYPPLDAWFEVRAYPSPDGLSVYFHDATRRRETEARLRASERHLRELSEHLREVIWISDPGYTRVEFVSDAYEKVWGRSARSLYENPRSFLDAVVPEDRPRVEATIPEMSAGWYEVEYRIRRPDGQIRWVWARGYGVRDGGEQVTRIVGIAEDITARKQAEDTNRFLAEAGRVLASSLEYERTLQNVAELAVRHLADWCVVDLCEDRRIRRLVVATADPEKEELTREYQRLYPPDPDAPSGGPHVIRTGRPELLSEVSDEALRAASRDDAQYELFRRLGFRSAMAVPLRAQDRTLGAITLISGRPERHYGPEELRVAELLADRAALSVSKALLYREAQEATRLRDEVLSVVSHDLRNPLNTILLSAGFLCDTLPEEQTATLKQMRIILRAARQGSRLIEDLLDIARIESGHLTLEMDEHDPRMLALEACESMRPLADEKELRLTCELPQGLPRVRADRDRILQVFGNLVGNAIKFTPEQGDIRVEVRAAAGEVRFSVSDTGPGIAPEDRPHLFNRFYQAKHARRGGAGLGLAISRGIVEAHGGRIGVESEVGRGSTFFFVLPVIGSLPESGA